MILFLRIINTYVFRTLSQQIIYFFFYHSNKLARLILTSGGQNAALIIPVVDKTRSVPIALLCWVLDCGLYIFSFPVLGRLGSLLLLCRIGRGVERLGSPWWAKRNKVVVEPF